jgi:DNA-binding CsgD family transcriptional regulator
MGATKSSSHVVTAVVGRQTELAAVDAAIDGARNRRGGAVFVVGEVGIGKSWMAAEAVRRASDAGVKVMRGRASSLDVSVPFRPVTEALLSLFREEGVPAYPGLVPYRRALGRLIPEWRDAGLPDGSDTVVVLAEAVLRLASAVGRDTGCLLVLEDLHDADAETLTIVEYLAYNLNGRSATLLGTIRAGLGAACDLAHSAGRRHAATVLDLAPLAGDELHRLASAHLGVDPADLPELVAERVRADCGGNPFVVRELLDELISTGILTLGADGWRVGGRMPVCVPTSLVRAALDRAGRLGPHGYRILTTAAVIGPRFPVTVVQEVIGLAGRELSEHIRAAVADRLIVADGQLPDWYAFRCALTAEALPGSLGPVERAGLARHAAEVIESRYPDLAGDRCRSLARLWLAAGERGASGRYHVEAGRRALADGTVDQAVPLLERAHELLSGDPADPAYLDLLETLLQAFVDTGQFGRALEFTGRLDAVGGGLTDRNRTALLVHVIWAAAMSGRVPLARTLVAAARERLDDQVGPQARAPIDAVAAFVALAGPDPSEAEPLATRAADTAVRTSLWSVACWAWNVLGLVARRRGLDESDRYFREMATLATQRGLLTCRIRATALLATNDALRTGTVDRLASAYDEAVRAGAVAAAYDLDASVGFQAVLRGDYQVATDIVERCWSAAGRLGYAHLARQVLLTRAALAAHRGQRAELERALEECDRRGGRAPHEPVTYRLCRALCALLEEDPATAVAELVRDEDDDRRCPTPYPLDGRHGPHLLLRAILGELEPSECRRALDAPPGKVRWNRHYVLLAHAVLAGRAGRPVEAEALFASAQDAGEPFPLARHLGARLVAEAALADGWGRPVPWLRAAEDHFHRAGVTPVAAACRALLRRVGASVGQRRQGHDRLPDELRRLRVTVREHEVLALLADRMGNKEIARRLFISPRTVEKHVASLITKVTAADRAALAAYAARAARS